MKFYGIESEGKFRVPTVTTLPTYDYTKHKGTMYYQTSDDAIYTGVGDAEGDWVRNGVESLSTLPTWTTADEGKIVYVEDTNLMYYGNSERWSSINETISDDLILHISTTGNDTTGNGTEALPWVSVNKAFDWLSNKRISSDSVVVIQIGDGTYTYDEMQRCNHPDGSRISIKGQNYYNKNMTQVVSATTSTTMPASGGLLLEAVLQLNNTDNIVNGDWVFVRNAFEVADDSTTVTMSDGDTRNRITFKTYTNRTEPHHINGVWQVTLVSPTTSRITVSARMNPNAVLPNNVNIKTGTYSGEITVIKSILKFPDSAGLIVDNGNTLGTIDNKGIDNLLVIGCNYNETYDVDDPEEYFLHACAIQSAETSLVELGDNVGTFGWWTGFGIRNSSSMIGKHIIASNCNRGIFCVGSSEGDFYIPTFSYCSTGIRVQKTSSCRGFSGVFINCNRGNYLVHLSNSHQPCCAYENCIYGQHASYNAYMHASGLSYYYNCTYGLCVSRQSASQGGGTYNNCTTGMYCGSYSYCGGGGVYNSCTTDESPVGGNEGNTGAYMA